MLMPRDPVPLLQYIGAARGTTSIGVEEPPLFSEPSIYLRRDDSLYCGAVQTMPFARPRFDERVGAIEFAIAIAIATAKDYPARGEYTGAL